MDAVFKYAIDAKAHVVLAAASECLPRETVSALRTTAGFLASCTLCREVVTKGIA